MNHTINTYLPLVSISVITYNSSKYVLETLESAKAQTYQNIELIVSDDCSTDNTVEICRNWIDEHKDRFVRTKLITVEKNTGIPANFNRGVRASQGEWVKPIAGDDSLYPNAIENVISVVEAKSDIFILLTQVDVYFTDLSENNYIRTLLEQWQKLPILQDGVSSDLQIEYLLKCNNFPAPGLFIKNVLIKEVGGFDENYTLIEDVPFLLKVLFAKKVIFFRPIITVKYRKHSLNLTTKGKNVLPLYYLQYTKILVEGSKNHRKLKFIINSYWNFLFVNIIFTLGNKGLFCLLINKFRSFFQPLRVFYMNKKLKL